MGADFLPLFNGWDYKPVVLGNPALQPAQVVQPNQPLVILPKGATGWFYSAGVTINDLYAYLVLEIDDFKITTNADALVRGGLTGFKEGLIECSLSQTMITDTPQYGPVYSLNLNTIQGPIPFRKKVSVYFLTQKPVTLLAGLIMIALVTDQAAFTASVQTLYGTGPPATGRT